MTTSDLTNLIITMQYEHSLISQELSKKMRLGLQYSNTHLTKLYQLNIWLGILQNYELYAEDDTTNNNYFTPTEMIEMNSYVNSLLGTVYSADFILN